MFKPKQKENIKLKEVCSNCCKPIEISASSETDPNHCCCYPVETNQGEIAEQKLAPTTVNESKVPTIELGERFEVLEVIGYGGMGTVYRARDKELGKDFAIKVLKDELATDESAIKRFEQEANAASDLTHLNMLAVYGHGKTTAGSHYIVMDLLEGESLAQLLQREGKLDANRAINISIQVCQALAHAHMKGLVHRDLKPSNIMLVKSGSSVDLVKVLDFGIAKLMPGEKRETMNLTQTGEIFGSPSYMSPEQCLGLNQDARSDIYSLGCMMYEMLTGKPPLVGKNPIQTVAKHLNEEALPLSKVVQTSKIPQGLEATIMRCLEKEAEQRYQTMDHLSADLQLISSGLRPKQKKKKSQKSIDLLSVPLLAAYISASVLIGYTGQESLQKGIPVFWLSILSMYFWRWLTGRSVEKLTSSEKWKRGLIWSLFIAFVASIPAVTVSYFEVQLPFHSELHCLYNVLMVCLVSFAIPITAFGWFLSSILSTVALSQEHRRGILTLLFLIPIVSIMFARQQIAWIPFKLSQTLRTGDGGILAPVVNVPADALGNLSILLNPNFVDAYYARAFRNRIEDPAQSISDFNKVVELSKSENSNQDSFQAGQAMRMILRTHLETKQYDLALKDLSQLLEKNSNIGGYKTDSYTRAKCYEKLKLYKNALADYNVAIGSQIFTAYADRARLNVKLGHIEQALSDYATSLEMQPDNRATLAGRAALLKRLGKESAATADYQKIVALHSASLTASNDSVKKENSKDLYYTALAYKALAQKSEANALFEKLKQQDYKGPAIEIDLDNDESLEPFY